MRVLICIPCLLTGGTEIQTLSMVRALIGTGHQTTTVCYFEYDEEMVRQYQEAGCHVLCLSRDGKRPLGIWNTIRFLYSGLHRTLQETKPDVAHVQYMAPGAIPIVILRLLGLKTILATAHTMADIYPSLRLLHFLQRHLLTAFTCITERAEQSFFGSSQLYDLQTALQTKGNHLTIHNCLPGYIQVINEPRIFDAPITIGVVSRLEAIKGMDMVVPAFCSIHANHPELRLLVVGDGSLRPAMEQAVTERGLTEHVKFVGRQPQDALQAFYDRIDILLIPSRSEGFGLTALEGMARGCVVIAANTGGLPEVVLDGKTGLLFSCGNVEAIADKVLQLVSTPASMQSMSCSAAIRARQFSVSSYNALIADLYEKIQLNRQRK